MKGTSLIVAAIGLMVILIVFVSVASMPVIKPGEIEKDIEVRSEIHIMGNALDAAKLYTGTALGYSVYQGCYDVLQKGGWWKLEADARHTGTGLALWSGGKYPDERQFIGNLQESINASLELYRRSAYRFLSDYYVDMPSHSITIKPYDSSGMTVSASSDRSFFIEKTQESGEYIRLEKDSSLYGDYGIACYGVYEKGVEAFSQAEGRISHIIQSAGTQTTEPEFDVKNATFKADVDSAVAGLGKKDGDYGMAYEVLSASLVQNSVLPSGIGYAPTVYVKFTVTNTTPGHEFPVYDSEEKSVAFRDMELVFVGKFA
jgi:hypothetical protein